MVGQIQRRKTATKAPASRTGANACLTTTDQSSSQDQTGNLIGCSREEKTVAEIATRERMEERELVVLHGEGGIENFPKTHFYSTLETLIHGMHTLISPTKSAYTQKISTKPGGI